jgi:hypothetical protein
MLGITMKQEFETSGYQWPTALLAGLDDATRQTLTAQLAQTEAARDPEQAALRMLKVDPADARWHVIMQQWMARDSEAASRFIPQIPTEAMRDDAIGALVDYLVDDEHEPDLSAAAAWSLAITDPELRLHQINDVIASSSGTVEETAVLSDLISGTSQLTPDQRASLLRRIQAP